MYLRTSGTTVSTELLAAYPGEPDLGVADIKRYVLNLVGLPSTLIQLLTLGLSIGMGMLMNSFTAGL